MKNYTLFKLFLFIEIIIFIFLIILNKSLLKNTILVYLTLSFLFLATRFSVWGFSDLFPKNYKRTEMPYTVMVPVKDEKVEIFIECLRRIILSNKSVRNINIYGKIVNN